MRTILILTLIPLVLALVLGCALISNPEIEYQIGNAFLKGEIVPKNHDWGFFWLKRAAAGGYVEAQSALGRAYLVGLPEQDLKEAIKYLSLGEKKNNKECVKLLGYAYAYGQGVPQDYGKAIELSKRSLNLDNDGRELMNLSFFHLILNGEQRNYKLARAYSEELMKLGYTSAWAYWSLGVSDEYGLTGKKDLDRALKMYSMGSKLGDNDCQYALVRGAMEGKFSQLDAEELRDYLTNAANTQVLDAQVLYALVLATENRDEAEGKAYGEILNKLERRGFSNLAQCLKVASPPGKSQNANQVIQKLLRGAGDSDPASQLVCALLRRFGIGVKPDFNAFMNGIDAACTKKLPDALTLKANILTCMEAGDPDYEQAVLLYTEAARANQAYAQGQLGMLFALGLGTQHDWTKAIENLNSAASIGDPEAQYMLAGFYTDGRGVKPDRKRAMELFERAARQGHEDAMLELGIISGAGEFPDIKEDFVKAEKWLRQAAGYGFQEANFYLASMLANRGSPEAINCFEAAAEKGHLLSQIQAGRYYLSMDDYKKAGFWFDKAIAQGSLTAKAELKLLKLRKAMLRNNRKAPYVVEAASPIEKGTILTKSLLRTKANELEGAEWQDEVLTDCEPALTMRANKNIAEGELISVTDLEVSELRRSVAND